MLDYAIPAFVTLFVIIDPIGLVPIFIALTQESNLSHKRKMARNGCFIAFIILLAFALFGKSLLTSLGISLAAFRIAGGALLFLIAIEMVFEKRSQKRAERADEAHDDQEPLTENSKEFDDIAAFPLAMPFLAGPGAIASIMLLMGEYQGNWEAQAAVIGAMSLVILIAYLLFSLGGSISKYIAPSITVVLTRLFGMLLAALSVQFLIDGIKQSFL